MTAPIQEPVFSYSYDRIDIKCDGHIRGHAPFQQGPKHEPHRDYVLMPKAVAPGRPLREGLFSRMAVSVEPPRRVCHIEVVPPRRVSSHAPIRASETFPNFVIAVMHSPKPVPTSLRFKIAKTRPRPREKHVLGLSLLAHLVNEQRQGRDRFLRAFGFRCVKWINDEGIRLEGRPHGRAYPRLCSCDQMGDYDPALPCATRYDDAPFRFMARPSAPCAEPFLPTDQPRRNCEAR